MIDFIVNKPQQLKTQLICLFAHGAGAPMDSGFMNTVAEGVSAGGIEVRRFEFPYMQKRRQTGIKRPPDRAPALLAYYREVIAASGGAQRCIIAGKSMGGRMASLIAAEQTVGGLVCLGYPFHALGKPDKTRIDHLGDIGVPNLILQGTRDPMGSLAQVTGYQLPATIKVNWLEDGDHDLKPRKKSGFSHEDHMKVAVDQIVNFILSIEHNA